MALYYNIGQAPPGAAQPGLAGAWPGLAAALHGWGFGGRNPEGAGMSAGLQLPRREAWEAAESQKLHPL